MSHWIRSLAELSRADTPQVGDKSAALGELRRAGFNIPPGIVLTTTAYSEFIAPIRGEILARLTDEVISDPADLEAAATAIRARLETHPFPPNLQIELESALAHWSESERSSLAARTSVAADELATATGTGVERASLGLVGHLEITRAAARGWAAVWNSRAMYYRHRKKITQTDVALAILLQPMVRATSAGVLFTQNPMSGARDEMQIKSIWGLGAPLTSARFRPDEFVFDKTRREITSREIQEQVVQLVVGQDGHTEERALPDSLIEHSSLTDAQLSTLTAVGQHIEDFFQSPQDIEWAFERDELYILQARPVAIRNA